MTTKQRTALKELIPNESPIELWSQNTPNRLLGYTPTTDADGVFFYSLYGILFLTVLLLTNKQFILAAVAITTFLALLLYRIFRKNKNVYIAIYLTNKAVYILNQITGEVLNRLQLESIKSVKVHNTAIIPASFTTSRVFITYIDETLNKEVLVNHPSIFNATAMPGIIYEQIEANKRLLQN